MIDYTFEYNGGSYRIPKNKIFECLYQIGEILPIGEFQTLSDRSQSMKAAKIFCVMGDYCKNQFDPLEVARHYLHTEDQAGEIYIAIGGLAALLNPPETYHPPETDEAGK